MQFRNYKMLSTKHFIFPLLFILCAIVALTLIYHIPVFFCSLQKSGTFLINTKLYRGVKKLLISLYLEAVVL